MEIENTPRCDCNVIHHDVVKSVKETMPEENLLYDVSDFFKVFGDSTRIKILCALSKSEMCVCDIAVLLNMTKSSISHQLRILKQNRLVRYRRAGKTVYYSLDDGHIVEILQMATEHILERNA